MIHGLRSLSSGGCSSAVLTSCPAHPNYLLKQDTRWRERWKESCFQICAILKSTLQTIRDRPSVTAETQVFLYTLFQTCLNFVLCSVLRKSSYKHTNQHSAILGSLMWWKTPWRSFLRFYINFRWWCNPSSPSSMRPMNKWMLHAYKKRIFQMLLFERLRKTKGSGLSSIKKNHRSK